MVTEQLTEQMQAEGRTLTEALDATELRINSAFWFYFSDAQQWRYVFSTSAVDRIGPRKVYRKVRNIIDKLKKQLTTLDLATITAFSSKHPLIHLLSFAVGTGPDIGGIRFSRNTINGQFIEDAYIYRITKAS